MKKITFNDFEKNHKKSKRNWQYCLVFLLGTIFMGVSSYAQTIQLGSGTTTNSYLPINYLYDKNYTQTIYTAAELIAAGATSSGGTITKIRFKPTASVSTENWRNWTIYMDNTTKESFTSTADWIPTGELTQVFTGNIPDNAVANSWMEITLVTPFAWDGSNVAIAITETTAGWGNSPNWAGYTLAPSTGNKAIFKYQDGADISITSPPAGTLSNLVAQIQFDGSLQEPCAGTPDAGTATLSANTGNSGSTFVASAPGVTAAIGLTYQWQKYIADQWQDIEGATTKTSTITAETGEVGDEMMYRLKVTCVASGEVAYSTTATFTLALVYCTPSGGENNTDEIINFTLSNLNNTSPASSGVVGYSDYTNLPAAQLSLGVSYFPSLLSGSGSGNHGAAIWIDYDNNGTFEASEKVTFLTNSIGGNSTVVFPEFEVPEGTALGVYRLRLQYHYAKSGDLLDPCIINSFFAETEDYSVEVLPAPTCMQPTGLTASNITSNSAKLSWTSTGSLFDIQYGPQGFTPGEGTMVEGVSSPYVLNQVLSPSTFYSFYVRQDCGDVDGLSLWTGPYTFTTTCAPVTEFAENFDSYTATGASNPLPTCWTRFGTTGSSYITTGSAAPMSPSNRLLLSGNATGPTNGVAVLPQVSNLGSATHRLRFKAYAASANKSLEIGYYELDNPTNFVVLEEFEMPSSTVATSEEFIYTPAFIPEGLETIAFRTNGGAFTETTTIYIDDVSWEAIPLCADLSEITIQNITTNSADIEWYTEGSETAWDYVYAPSTVTSPEGLTPTTVNDNAFFTLSNLESSTVYNFWIRSNCGSGNVGIWSAVKTFTTLCGPATLPYTIDFESASVPNLPLCTVNQNVGSGNDWKTYSGTNSGFTGKFLRYTYNSNNAANTWFFTNMFNLVAGTTYSVSYKYGAGLTTYTEKLKVAYGTAADDAAMTTILADHPNVNFNVPQNNTVEFTPTASGLYVIGFNAYSPADGLFLQLDDILIQEALGVADFNNNKFVAYPNPVKDVLTVRYNESIDNVSVFNLLGQQLFAKNINATEGKVDMANLSSGTYLVKITSGEKTQTIKVIKE